MSEHPARSQPFPARLPIVEAARTPVPVFDCHVLLSGPDEEGRMTAQCSTLPHIAGTGGTEREALLAVVAAFKQELRRYIERGEAIPWADPPLTRQPGQQERWIPVHL